MVADGDRAEARDGNADELGYRRSGTGGEAGPAEADHASERDDPDYWVLVRASYAGYLAAWLLDAATEYLVQPREEVP